MIYIFIVGLIFLLTATSAVFARTVPEDMNNKITSIAQPTNPYPAILVEGKNMVSASPTDILWQNGNVRRNAFCQSNDLLLEEVGGFGPQMECERCDVVESGWDPYWNICYTKWHCCNYCTYHCEDWYELYPCP